jgi:signal recognition particle receptor subunit beta
MAHSPTGLRLPEVAPARRLAAVRAVLARQSAEMPRQVVDPSALIGRLPSPAKLRAGAVQAQKEEAEDARAAEYFESLLELGYLVASADGLAAEERETLALLLEHATESSVSRDVLQLHFSDLDATSAALGRSERLGRVAANFDSTHAREEAISFGGWQPGADRAPGAARARSALRTVGRAGRDPGPPRGQRHHAATGGKRAMTFLNHMSREMNCKIVYYGPGLCGKTTNLQYIHDRTAPTARGKMISLATESDRTLFFDFMPLELGKIGEYKIRLHLYTVPGQVFYEASRKLILRGVDGVVFVADSQIARLDANEESLEDLANNLTEYNHTLETIPFAIQYNKRDLPGIASVEELRAQLNPKGVLDFEAAAPSGAGVMDTLKGISKLVLRQLKGS